MYISLPTILYVPMIEKRSFFYMGGGGAEYNRQPQEVKAID